MSELAPAVRQVAPRIEELLSQQVDVLASLVEVMQHERLALVSLDVEAVERATKEKEALCLRQDVLERARQQTVERAGLAELSLREIAELRGGEAGQRLLELRSNLRALASAVADLNALCHGLMEHARHCVSGTLQILKEALADRPTYGGRGRLNAYRPPSGTALSRRL